MPFVQSRTPVPGGKADFRLIGLAAMPGNLSSPFTISKDRKTLYGGGSTNTQLMQSVDDGVTWTLVHTFPEKIISLMETDDGEAVATTQNGTSSPGYVYKSSGWTASHAAATWTLVLTSQAGYFPQNWSGHFCTFGDDALVPGTSRYGVLCEYGPQTTVPGPQAGGARRVYFTQDYGATWAQVFDLLTFSLLNGANVNFPLHTHASAYDPWWDRIWVTFGDTAQNNKLDLLYSDDHGVTWSQVDPPPEWVGQSAFQCVSIAILEGCLILGSDNGPGIVRLERTGYRKVGNITIAAQQWGHSNTGQIHQPWHRNRAAVGQPLLMADQSQATLREPSISATWDGETFHDLFNYPEGAGGSGGFSALVGPTYNGVIVGRTSASGLLLRGEIVPPTPGAMDYVGYFTGDGATTVFNIPHGLGKVPTFFNAWPRSAAAASGSFTTTADATNLIITFVAAPANAALVRIGAVAQ